MSKKRENYFKRLVIEYAHSILQLVEGIKDNNINQVISLIKANIRVLENDVKESFTKQDHEDFNYREMN